MTTQIYNGLQKALADYGLHVGDLFANARPSSKRTVSIVDLSAYQQQAPFNVWRVGVTFATSITEDEPDPQTIINALGTFMPLDDREPGDATLDNTQFFTLLSPPTVESSGLAVDPQRGTPIFTVTVTLYIAIALT